MSKEDNKKTPAQPDRPPAKFEPVIVPPLFRKIDWLTLMITFGVVWAIYI